MSYYAISRLQNYKYSECGAVLKEALRTLPNYDNPDCDPSRSWLNIALVKTDFEGLTFEKYLLKYRKDNNIRGRFNLNSTNKKNMTNVCSQALFTLSPDYINAMSRDEQIEYFNCCLDFFKQEFPTAKIISAVIHYDETTPHMHVTFLPIAERVNKHNEIEQVFSTTDLMPGKEFFHNYQERFYNYITGVCGYTALTRSYSTRKNLSPQEYKKYQELLERLLQAKYERQELYDEIERLKAENSDLKYWRDLFMKIPILGLIVEIFTDGFINDKNDKIADVIEELQKLKVEVKDRKQSLDEKIAAASSKSDEKNSKKERFIDKIFR